MAITMLNDLIPYDKQYREGYVDYMRDTLDVFGAKSRNTFVLKDNSETGTLSKIAFFEDFGVASRRDITSTSAQEPGKIERSQHTTFRTFDKFNLLSWQAAAFYTADKMRKGDVVYMIGQSVARTKLKRSIDKAIISLVGAIESQGATTVLDLTTPTKQNFLQPDMVAATLKYGDSQPLLKAMVMTSAAFACLTKNQLVNERYDLGAGTVIYGGTTATLGMPVIVCDNPKLMYTSGSDTLHRTLILTDSAVTIGDSDDMLVDMNTVSGEENIRYTFQAEWSQWIDVKGYELKASANPQSNPDETALATANNWQRWVADFRNGAGLMVKSLADLSKIQQIMNVKVIS